MSGAEGISDRGIDPRPDPRWSGVRRHPTLVALGAVALSLVASYWWSHLLAGARYPLFDLRIYDAAVRYWANGNDLYAYAQFDSVNGTLGFTYPPLAAALMSPMAVLDWPVVSTLTVVAILACGAFCVWVCLRERWTLPSRATWVAGGIGTAVAFALEPIRLNLGFGQINLFLGALVLGDLLVLGRRNSRWTGVGIGLAMAVKITPGIFLLYLLLARQWRAAVVAVATAAGTTLGAALIAPAETRQFFGSLLFSDRTGYVGATANQSINGLIARFAYPAPPSRLLWLGAVVLVGIIAVVRIRAALRRDDRLAALTLTGLAGVLVSPVSWAHHFVWVIPAVVVVAAQLWHTTTSLIVAAGNGNPGGLFARLRPAIGSIVLTVSGLLILGFDTRVMFGLPGVDYTSLSPIRMLLGSLLMFWSLAALCLLPLGVPRYPTGLSWSERFTRLRAPLQPTDGTSVGRPRR